MQNIRRLLYSFTWWTAVVWLFLFLADSGGQVHAATIEGIILSSAGPLPDAVVKVYHDFIALVAGKNPIISNPGDKSGVYRLELAPGTYYFVAHGNKDGKPLFSYHGLNPIIITEEYRWLPFCLVDAGSTEVLSGTPGIEGQVLYHDRPVGRGTVSVYPVEDGRFRGMGLFSNSLGPEGRFRFDLDPGLYVVVARQRRSGTDMGPLEKGDLFCFPAANPIKVTQDHTSKVEIPCYPRDDLEAFLVNADKDPRGKRMLARRAASLAAVQPFETAMAPIGTRKLVATISGQVQDISGRPRPGLFVCAYPANEPPFFQMYLIRMITNFMALTDDQGRYFLRLDRPGAYFLVVREKVGEPPDSMEYYGLYEGTVTHSVIVANGDHVIDVDMKVEQIMPQPAVN